MNDFPTENQNENRHTRLTVAVLLLTVAGCCLWMAAILNISSEQPDQPPFLNQDVSADLHHQIFEYSQADDSLILLAAKSANADKVSSGKKKSTKVKKRTNRAKKKSPSTSRKKVRKSSLEASRRRVAYDFFEYMSIGIVGFALFGLYLRYQKEFNDDKSDLKDLTAAPVVRPGQYEAKPVVLSDPAGPDPMTFKTTDVFQRVAAHGRKPSVTLDLALEGPELEESISSEIDDIISSIKIIDDGSKTRVPEMLLLPAEMLGHFDGLPGETLKWSAPLYIKGVCEGMMAITNLRILTLYERRSLKLWLPSVIYQTKRNQTLLEQISLYKPVQVNRPSFLALGTCLFWWFPFGTVGACFAIACFLFLTRRELGVWTSSQKRTYPLSMVDLEESMSTIGKITGIQPLGRSEQQGPLHKAG